MSHRRKVVRRATGRGRVRCGVGGPVARLAGDGQPDWSLAGSQGSGKVPAMAFITPHRRAPRLGVLVGGSVFGALLTAAGLGIGYLVLATPLPSMLSTNQLSGSGRLPIGLGIWSLSMVACGALLLAGTNRLAVTIAMLRTRGALHGTAAHALATMADDVAVLAGVVPNEGRPIPELASDHSGRPSSTPCRPHERCARSARRGRRERPTAGSRSRARSTSRRATPTESDVGWRWSISSLSFACTRRWWSSTRPFRGRPAAQS